MSMPDETITQAVSERYARAAAMGEQMCCPTGYDLEALRQFIPDEVLKISYGCGTPLGLEAVKPGETVLDIGSGGGIDCFDAARRVGPTGRVIGLDMTDTMLEIARRNAPMVARHLGYPIPNVEFRKGQADAMPLPDADVDLIISNCVINLAPDKDKVFREMFRVLRPGGRFTISDIVADQIVPRYLVHDTQKWGDCLSGALQIGDYLKGLVQAGFRGLHHVKFMPWQLIDGIHFVSLTLTGYKLIGRSGARCFATLRGPFRRVVTEQGVALERGTPTAVDAHTAEILRLPGSHRHVLLTDTPVRLEPGDPRFCAVLPDPVPCVWKGDYGIFIGPFMEAEDDDHHVYRRGVPMEICSKTLKVLDSEPYRPQFAIINRAAGAVSANAVTCGPESSCC